MATWYVQKGLEAELNSTKEGHLNNGDTIAIEFRVYDNTSENTKAAYARLVEYWWGTDNNPGVIKRAVEKIKQIAVENKVATIVVGVPINMDGTYGFQSEDCKNFAGKINGFDIVFEDERLTSNQAEENLRQRKMKN